MFPSTILFSSRLNVKHSKCSSEQPHAQGVRVNQDLEQMHGLLVCYLSSTIQDVSFFLYNAWLISYAD